jgi:hypothetical protein
MFDFFKKRVSKKKLQEPKLIMTTTEELLMPVRLYYTIHNKKSLIKALRKLKCVLFSKEDENHFIISYHKEAKKFNLAVPYQEVPKELYPITLAEGYIVGNCKLHIDARSLRRGVELVDFLVKFIIPSSIIEITDMANYNKVTVARDEDEYYQWFNVNYSELFDNVRITDHNVELLNPIQKLLELNEDSGKERKRDPLEELDKKNLIIEATRNR